MNKAEPRFDLDYGYGREGELKIDAFLRQVTEANGEVEVKRKRYIDHRFYVETHCDKGRRGEWEPSGILTSTAHTWFILVGDTGIGVMIPAALLRRMIDDPSSADRAEADGSCPTRGKLIDFCVLLYRLKCEQPRATDSLQDAELTAAENRRLDLEIARREGLIK